MAKKTHELALCGVLCALAVAFLWLSGVLLLSTYIWPILASATLLPAHMICLLLLPPVVKDLYLSYQEVC